MDRREFLTSVGALSALSVLPVSFSQAAELTKKYSGTTLRVMLGAGGGAFDVYKKMTEAFTQQTGITFDYTTLPDADYYSKIVLDVTTGTNAFDAYLYTYFWKGRARGRFCRSREAGSDPLNPRRRSVSKTIQAKSWKSTAAPTGSLSDFRSSATRPCSSGTRPNIKTSASTRTPRRKAGKRWSPTARSSRPAARTASACRRARATRSLASG